MNFAFRLGDALEDGNGFLFHPGRKPAAGNQLLDFGEISLVAVRVLGVGVRKSSFVVVMVPDWRRMLVGRLTASAFTVSLSGF